LIVSWLKILGLISNDLDFPHFGLTVHRSQPPLALAVPLSQFTPRVGGGFDSYIEEI
jgi:hypothetical protein